MYNPTPVPAIKFPDKTRNIPTLMSVYISDNAFGVVALFFRVIPVVLIRVHLVDDIGPAELLGIRQHI